jgi:hypothetical protein
MRERAFAKKASQESRLGLAERRRLLQGNGGRSQPRPFVSELPLSTPSRLFAWTLAFVAVLPALYVFVAIQYAAVTFPFWDHTDLLRELAPLYDGHFQISSLWAPHNHSRPLTLRLVYLANARLSGWDVRSEFVYVYLAIYGTFVLQLAILWRLTGRRLTVPFASGALVMSIIYFSPSGHMNQWWSMMLQLDLANLFIVYALWRVANSPASWKGNIVAAAAGWLATYTLTNGLILMIVLAALVQATRPNPWRADSRTLFWGANVLTIFVLYFHNLPSEEVQRPGPLAMMRFAAIYLGSPLADLLHFPFHGPFDLPTTTTLQTVCGVVLVAGAAALCVRARHGLRSGEPAAMLLVGFSLFAVGSALATAWDRARFDALGVALASSSRYTIFAAYLLYGLIYFGACSAARAGWAQIFKKGTRRAVPVQAHVFMAAVLAAAVAIGAVSYVHGARVYRAVHRWNDALGLAYQLTPSARQFDPWVYGIPSRSEEVRADLLRLHLAPYREVQTVSSAAPAVHGVRRGALVLNSGSRIYEEFVARQDRLVMIAIPVAANRFRGALSWTLFRIERNKQIPIGESTVSLDGARTRGTVAFVTGDLGRTSGKRFGLLLRRNAPASGALAFPLFTPDKSVGPVLSDGVRRSGLTIPIIQSFLVAGSAGT